jgi:hypothetical protein
LAVVQKQSEEHDGREAHLLLSLDCYSKLAGDERNLLHDVSFFHTTHLSFPHHVHHFISAIPVRQTVSKEKKPSPGLTRRQDEAVILLNNVVQVLNLPQFDCLGKRTESFQVCNGFGISGIHIDSDYPRSQRSGVRISSCGLFYRFFNRMDVRS